MEGIWVLVLKSCFWNTYVYLDYCCSDPMKFRHAMICGGPDHRTPDFIGLFEVLFN